jgi:hypothetical protein
MSPQKNAVNGLDQSLGGLHQRTDATDSTFFHAGLAKLLGLLGVAASTPTRLMGSHCCARAAALRLWAHRLARCRLANRRRGVLHPNAHSECRCLRYRSGRASLFFPLHVTWQKRQRRCTMNNPINLGTGLHKIMRTISPSPDVACDVSGKGSRASSTCCSFSDHATAWRLS